MSPVVRRACLPSLLGLLLLTSLPAGRAPAAPPSEGEGKAPPKPGLVDVHFTDGSTLKLTLQDERLEVTTPYGKLRVPVADVRRIEFATRVSDEDARKIEAAVADLGSPDFHKREAAAAALLALREKAYPALLEASQQKDPEVVRRAEGLLEQLRQTVPEKQLTVRKHDVIETADSKFTGRIEGAALKAQTAQFGDVALRLPELLSLRTPAAGEERVAAKAEPDPGNLLNYQNQLGKTFRFRVTGAPGGPVWGTGVYTADSSLATAAVHAGVLKPGQTAVVKVTIVPPPPVFPGSVQNGVMSFDFGPYPGAYRVSK